TGGFDVRSRALWRVRLGRDGPDGPAPRGRRRAHLRLHADEPPAFARTPGSAAAPARAKPRGRRAAVGRGDSSSFPPQDNGGRIMSPANWRDSVAGGGQMPIPTIPPPSAT